MCLCASRGNPEGFPKWFNQSIKILKFTTESGHVQLEVEGGAVAPAAQTQKNRQQWEMGLEGEGGPLLMKKNLIFFNFNF